MLVAGGLASSDAARASDVNENGIDDRLELPGTQPGVDASQQFNIDTTIAPADGCVSAGCHSATLATSPGQSWSGSMMANAGRDPVFWAQLDLAEADEATVTDGRLDGFRDLCLRCHAPKGWLEGRSHDPAAGPGVPPDPEFLRGMRLEQDDLRGVQCENCHRMVDPSFDVAMASVDPVDRLMLDGGTGTGGLLAPNNPAPGIPQSFGAGMYVMDRKDVRRGPYDTNQIGYHAPGWEFINTVAEWLGMLPEHPVRQSDFHRESDLCGTCHDVSNPAWASEFGGTLGPDTAIAQQHFPIERTYSEWKHSAFPAKGESGNCQSCHMSGPLNGHVAGPASENAAIESPGADLHLNDIHTHDFTGGNVVMPLIINEMIQQVFTSGTGAGNGVPTGTYPTAACTADPNPRDCFLEHYYISVIRELYPDGAFAKPGADPTPSGYSVSAQTDAASRARATLSRAADLSKDASSTSNSLAVRVWNKTGHKLPTGYPEGRRMWLEVEFEDISATDGVATTQAWSGEYSDAADDSGYLFYDTDLNGSLTASVTNDRVAYTDGTGTGAVPVIGGSPITAGRRTQVWEARSHYDAGNPTDPADGTEFHFALNNERLMDNRIPPEGWVTASYAADHADQVTVPAYQSGSQPQMVYTDACGEPTCNYDVVPYPRPATSDSAVVTLRFQSLSREYIKALQADSPRSLVYQFTGDPQGYTRGDVLEHAWRTLSPAGLGPRFPPVDMTTMRMAIVDTDGDGLPDDWETAHGLNPNGTSAAQRNADRYGDPDSDGLSNYREFQDDTDPNTAATPARPPLDLALVLDFSGSMSGIAPQGSQPKIDVLKDSVELFLATWEKYATINDRLAIVYFSNTVEVEGGTIVDFSTLSGQTVGERLDALASAVRTRSNGGATAMGGGLQRGLELVKTGGAGHRKHVILFTNGMQNYSPMVREDDGGTPADESDDHYVILAQDPATFSDVYGDSGVTDTAGPAFGTSLASMGVAVHTIGIGVAETADDRWLNLIQGIAIDSVDTDSNPGLYQFVSRASELEGAFLTNLVETLRNNSPQLIARYDETLSAQQKTVEMTFDMEQDAERATFVVSWAGAPSRVPLRLSVTAPDGTPGDELGVVRRGTNYLIYTAYFPLARLDGRPVPHAGTWTLRVGLDPKLARAVERVEAEIPTPTTVDFRAYAVAEIPDSNHAVRFSQRRYAAGEEVVLYAAARRRGGFIRHLDKVVADVRLPSQGFGTFLSQVDMSRKTIEATPNPGGDQLVDLAARKAYAALSDPKLAATVAPITRQVELFDDGDPAHGDTVAGDGLFAARLGPVQTPGALAATVHMSGPAGQDGRVARTYQASAVVTLAPLNEESVEVGAEDLHAGAEGPHPVLVALTPRDAFGNLLGPGYADRVVIRFPDGEADAPAIDLLDGRYGREITFDPNGPDVRVEVLVDDQVVYDGTVTSLLEGDTPVVPNWVWWVLVALLIVLLLVLLIWLIRRRRASSN